MILKMKSAAATATAVHSAPVRSMNAPGPAIVKKGLRRRVTPIKPVSASSTLHSASHGPANHTAHAGAALAGALPGQSLPVEIVPGNERVSKKDKLAAAQQAARLERRDRVVLEHLPLVKAIAVRVHENLPVHVDLDDLVHAGILGLFDAASKYNPDKQVAFSSYAKHRIKGAILDSLRQLDWASRDMRRRHKQVEAATRELSVALQRNPTEAEVAEKLGVDQERWRSMMLDLRNVGLISASTRSNENEDLPAPDFPSKPETQPDSICAHEQLRSVLGVAIKTLPERYQKVVSLYYTGELTMKEIGGILGINESRVSQIHKAALEKMQVVLEANGISNSQAF
jgi:RNA polymerase sigma factor FliA